jgi:hypothetical protein
MFLLLPRLLTYRALHYQKNNLSVVHTKLTHVICKRQSQPLDGARRDFKRDEVLGKVNQGHEAGQGPRGDGGKRPHLEGLRRDCRKEGLFRRQEGEKQ